MQPISRTTKPSLKCCYLKKPHSPSSYLLSNPNIKQQTTPSPLSPFPSSHPQNPNTSSPPLHPLFPLATISPFNNLARVSTTRSPLHILARVSTTRSPLVKTLRWVPRDFVHHSSLTIFRLSSLASPRQRFSSPLSIFVCRSTSLRFLIFNSFVAWFSSPRYLGFFIFLSRCDSRYELFFFRISLFHFVFIN